MMPPCPFHEPGTAPYETLADVERAGMFAGVCEQDGITLLGHVFIHTPAYAVLFDGPVSGPTVYAIIDALAEQYLGVRDDVFPTDVEHDAACGRFISYHMHGRVVVAYGD